jgi:hypothetical protein
LIDCWWLHAIFGERKPGKFGDSTGAQTAWLLMLIDVILPHSWLVLAAKRLFLVFVELLGDPSAKKIIHNTHSNSFAEPKRPWSVLLFGLIKSSLSTKGKRVLGLVSLLRPGVLDLFRRVLFQIDRW